MEEANVLFNKRNYPVDEFAEVYKDYDEVIKSVTESGLAREVARLSPFFVIKGEVSLLFKLLFYCQNIARIRHCHYCRCLTSCLASLNP